MPTANLYVNILVSVATFSITRLYLQKIGNPLQILYPNNSYCTKLLSIVKLMKVLKQFGTKFNALLFTLLLILSLIKFLENVAIIINTHLTVLYYTCLLKNLVILLNLLKNSHNILISPTLIKISLKLTNNHNVTFNYLTLPIHLVPNHGFNMLTLSGNSFFMLVTLKTFSYFDRKSTKPLTKDVLLLHHILHKLLIASLITITNLFICLI